MIQSRKGQDRVILYWSKLLDSVHHFSSFSLVKNLYFYFYDTNKSRSYHQTRWTILTLFPFAFLLWPTFVHEELFLGWRKHTIQLSLHTRFHITRSNQSRRTFSAMSEYNVFIVLHSLQSTSFLTLSFLTRSTSFIDVSICRKVFERPVRFQWSWSRITINYFVYSRNLIHPLFQIQVHIRLGLLLQPLSHTTHTSLFLNPMHIIRLFRSWITNFNYHLLPQVTS